MCCSVAPLLHLYAIFYLLCPYYSEYPISTHRTPLPSLLTRIAPTANPHLLWDRSMQRDWPPTTWCTLAVPHWLSKPERALVNTWGGSFTNYRFRHRIRTVLPVCFIMAAYLLKQTPEICTSIISHVVAAHLHPRYDSESLKKRLNIPQFYTLNLDSLLSAIDLSQTIGRVSPGTGQSHVAN